MNFTKNKHLEFASVLILLAVCYGLFMAFAQPTVTLSKSGRRGDLDTYEFSYATAIATLDSAFIYQNISDVLAFNVESHFDTDSMATLTLRSSEATADSIRHTVLLQGTSTSSPVAADWLTLDTNTTSFTNTATPAIINYRLSLLGQFRKLRVIIFESDADKDATQTVTGSFNIPK